MDEGETINNPVVSISLEFKSPFLIVRIRTVRNLNVTTGKIYAKSVLIHTERKESDEERPQCVTGKVDAAAASASKSFRAKMLVSFSDNVLASVYDHYKCLNLGNSI